MHKIVTLVLTFILFIVGVLIVFSNPLDPAAISIGMFLVAISILNIAIQIYFPAMPERQVELRVVETPEIPEVSKRVIKKKRTVRRKKR
jgi:hypothetical protein